MKSSGIAADEEAKMLQNLFNYIDSGALDGVFWGVAFVVLVVVELRKRRRERMAQRAFMQWLAIEKDQKMSQELKLELKDLILPLAVPLIILVAAYCSHWYMAWPIWATAIVIYLALYGGVVVAVLAIRRISPQASKAPTTP